MVLAIPFVDGWILDRVVEWDPGPRLNPVIATILLFGLPSVVLGERVAGRRALEGPLDRKPRPDGGAALRDLDGGLDCRTFLTSFWLIPEPRHRSGARVGRDRPGPGCRRGGAGRAARGCVCARAHRRRSSVVAAVSLAPDKGGTVAASQLQNWSPVYRQRSVDDRSGGIEESQTGYKIVETADSQYHRIAVVDDDTSRYPLRQLLPERDVPQRPVPDALHLLRLSPAAVRLPGADTPDALHRARRRLAPKRTWRDFPVCESNAAEPRPEGRRHRLRALRAAP